MFRTSAPAPTSSARHQASDRDRGVALVAVLVVIAILGGLSVALLAVNSSGSSGKGSSSLPPVAGKSIQASPGAAGADISAAAIEACRADVGIVNEAVSEYEAVQGQPPRTMADLSGMLKGLVASSRFTILINSARPGQVEVSTPDHAPAPGDTNCAFA